MGRSNITDPPTCFPYWHFWCKSNLKSVSIRKLSQLQSCVISWLNEIISAIGIWRNKNFTKWCTLYYCMMIYHWWFFYNIIPLRFPASNHEQTTNSCGCCFFCFFLLLPSVKLLNGLCSFLQLFKKFFFLSKQRGNENQFR